MRVIATGPLLLWSGVALVGSVISGRAGAHVHGWQALRLAEGNKAWKDTAGVVPFLARGSP